MTDKTVFESRNLHVYAAAFVALMIVVLIPFALCSPLPLSDYPNHLARMYIIANVDHVQALARYYSIEWSFIPNLAMDLLVPLAMPPMSAEVATASFLAIALALMASGAIALNWQLYQRPSFLPFVAFGLLFNRHFLWGFVNYLFSVGMALWMLAIYLRLRERHPLTRILVATALCVALLVAHLHAFASYAVTIVGIEVSIAWRSWRRDGTIFWKPLALSLVQFVVPILAFIVFSKPTRASTIRLGSIFDKMAGLLDLFNNYNRPLDIGTFLLVAVAVGIGLWSRRLIVHRDLRLSLAALFLLFLLLPSLLLGSFGADRRLLVMAGMLFVASLEVRGLGSRAQRAVAAVLVALFLVRTAVIGVNWIAAQQVYAPILAAIDRVEPGTRVAVISGGEIFPYLQNPPLEHVANMAVVRKNVFVNSLFAERGKQILQVYTGEKAPFSVDGSQNFRLPPEEIGKADPFPRVPVARFDYVLLINKSLFTRTYPGSFEPVFDEGIVTLFRLRHDVASAP